MLATLIPQSILDYNALHSGLLWVLCVAGIAMLVFGADRAVGSAVRLAAAAGMSTVLIGATVVSLGTTAPEAVVSVRAALMGDPGLALGNGVGSIICDTALIFGLACVLTRLPLNQFVLSRHGWLQLGAGALLTVVALVLWLLAGDITNVYIPRSVGLGFLVLLGVYMYLSVRWARQHPELIPEEARLDATSSSEAGSDHASGLPQNAIIPIEKKVTPRAAAKSPALAVVVNLALLLAGIALIVLGSEVLIGSVQVICERYNVPEEVLAATLVAFGTSLPELATAIASIIKGHPELLVGNIIGADILNVLFVIGASASAVPLRIAPPFFYFLLPVMMGSLILLRVYIATSGKTFRRWQGIPLLAIYVGFVIVLLTVFGAKGI